MNAYILVYFIAPNKVLLSPNHQEPTLHVYCFDILNIKKKHLWKLWNPCSFGLY